VLVSGKGRTGGFNPMRYKCEDSGCFNVKMRPKIEMFSDCFPGRISFGDVDAEVEINGRFLQLEWKTHGKNIPTGQAIKYKHYTRQKGWLVIVAVGCAETMKVERSCFFWKGKQSAWQEYDPEIGLLEVKRQVEAWAFMAKNGSKKQ